MGRIGAFPHLLARIHHKHRSPVAGILATFAVTIAVTLGLGFAYNPVTAFAMVGTGLVILLAAIYIVTNAACIGYFARRRRGWNPFLHLIIPVLGIAAFVPAWLTAAGIRAFSFVTPLTAPSSYMGPGVAGWMIVGLAYLIYLYARHPNRVTEVGLVHLDDPELPAG
jgi:amino acid transporter